MIPAFFEGPEKKVELAVVAGHPSLRALSDERWRGVVAASGASVISRRSNGHFDAYLLSESSLFVFDDFVTMITCGQTSLVDSVEAMLALVRPDDVAMLVYERKNEHFPHQQPTSFFDDARRLRMLLDGRALHLGATHEHEIYVFHTTREHVPDSDDATLEVLMHGIDPQLVATFQRLRPAPGSIAPAVGVNAIFEGFEVDEHVFSPSGYSVNGLRDDCYATLHVTPQRLGSYVSYETNRSLGSETARDLVRPIVELFRPESFDVVLFLPPPARVSLGFDGYVLRRHVQERVSGYDLVFLHFFRPPTGPVPATPLDID
jgi:S-adenosylmethionine decarboxylase